MKGAMEEATGPNAEPPFSAAFSKTPRELIFLFGFYLSVSKPRPHTHKNAQTVQINRNVCIAGMAVYKKGL